MNINLKFLNGFGDLLKNIAIKLVQFFPLYMLIFIAYGDKFLPSPFNGYSANTRNTINSVLEGSFNRNMLKNNQYNNKKTDQVIQEVEKNK